LFALIAGCDPNQLSNDEGRSPSDYCVAAGFGWAQWTGALDHAGYRLLETEEIGGLPYGYDKSIWVVVSASGHVGAKLPVSDATVDGWRAERARIVVEHGHHGNNDHNAGKHLPHHCDDKANYMQCFRDNFLDSYIRKESPLIPGIPVFEQKNHYEPRVQYQEIVYQRQSDGSD
jgi:hypothetical protein